MKRTITLRCECGHTEHTMHDCQYVTVVPADAATRPSPGTNTHTDPVTCTRGFNGARCPACASWWRHSGEAWMTYGEASDTHVRLAMEWLVGQDPSLVIRAFEETRNG